MLVYMAQLLDIRHIALVLDKVGSDDHRGRKQQGQQEKYNAFHFTDHWLHKQNGQTDFNWSIKHTNEHSDPHIGIMAGLFFFTSSLRRWSQGLGIAAQLIDLAAIFLPKTVQKYAVQCMVLTVPSLDVTPFIVS